MDVAHEILKRSLNFIRVVGNQMETRWRIDKGDSSLLGTGLKEKTGLRGTGL